VSARAAASVKIKTLPLEPNISEAAFQRIVVDVALLNGWRVHHTRPAMVRDGKYVTPITGHIGFPDLVLVHARTGRAVFAELKSKKGRLAPDQSVWREHLLACGLRHVIWRPLDYLMIVEFLCGERIEDGDVAPQARHPGVEDR
jgi:hypothetical protein